MPFNPYHHWLGLKAEIDNPNYFQLLEIGSKVEDESHYRAAVEEAVRNRIAILAKIDAGHRRPLLQQLGQRIQRAGSTLADPIARTEYLKKLKASAQGIAGEPAPPEPSVAREALPKISTRSPSPTLSKGQELVEAMAIETQPGVVSAAARTAKTRKKKLPTSILICTLLICIASIIGPLLVVNRLINREIATVDAVHNPSSGGKLNSAPVVNNRNGLRKENNQPATTITSESGHPKPVRPNQSHSTPKPADVSKVGNGMRSSAADARPTKSTQPLIRTLGDLESTPLEPAENSPVPVDIKEIDIYSIQSLCRRIQSAYSRRDSESVVLIGELEKKLSAMPLDTAQSLEAASELLASYKFMQTQLTGFWTVVRQGYGRALPKDFAVEGIPHQVKTFSNESIEFTVPAGTIKYFYEYMPPSVAIAGANNHSFVDTTANRLYLAAFIATQSGHVRNRYEDNLQKLLLLVEADSPPIRKYVAETFATQAVSLKGAMPETKLLGKAVEDFIAQNRAADAAKILPEEAARLSRQFLNQNYRDQEEAIIAVEAARRMAVASGNAYLLADAVAEMGYLTNINVPDAYLDSFTELIAKKLNAEQIQRMIEIVYPLTENADKDMVSRFKRLKTKLKKSGSAFGLLGNAQLTELR